MQKHKVVILTEQARRDIVAVIDHRDPTLLRKAAVLLENAPVEEVYNAAEADQEIAAMQDTIKKATDHVKKITDGHKVGDKVCFTPEEIKQFENNQNMEQWKKQYKKVGGTDE